MSSLTSFLITPVSEVLVTSLLDKANIYTPSLHLIPSHLLQEPVPVIIPSLFFIFLFALVTDFFSEPRPQGLSYKHTLVYNYV